MYNDSHNDQQQHTRTHTTPNTDTKHKIKPPWPLGKFHHLEAFEALTRLNSAFKVGIGIGVCDIEYNIWFRVFPIRRDGPFCGGEVRVCSVAHILKASGVGRAFSVPLRHSELTVQITSELLFTVLAAPAFGEM
jgi:hypothetical protein